MKILWLAVIPGNFTLPLESASPEHFAGAMDGEMDGEMDGKSVRPAARQACTLG